jgi:hypothetical protein
LGLSVGLTTPPWEKTFVTKSEEAKKLLRKARAYVGLSSQWWWWWPCRWSETTFLNCSHQRAFCSSPRWYRSIENHCGLCRLWKTPDPSTR